MIETVTVDVRKWILEIEPEEEYFSGVNDE